MIAGYQYDYIHYDRKLTIDDFKQFGYESTCKEIVECLGEENGNIGSGNFYPYYEADNGKYVIIRFWPELDSIRSIEVADKILIAAIKNTP